MTDEDDREAEARRSRGNFIALIAIVIIVVGGYWLYSTLKRANDAEVCAEQGLRNCGRLN